MLMAHAEKLAASSNFEQVKLYTNKLFVENVQLYTRLGYSVDREGAVVSGIKGHVIAERSDEAIHICFADHWIASLRSQ